MSDIDPDHIHPDAQVIVQSPDEQHTVDGSWWNEYVDKAKRAGVPLINKIVQVIDDAGQQIAGFEKTLSPAPAAPETPAETPAAPVE